MIFSYISLSFLFCCIFLKIWLQINKYNFSKQLLQNPKTALRKISSDTNILRVCHYSYKLLHVFPAIFRDSCRMRLIHVYSCYYEHSSKKMNFKFFYLKIIYWEISLHDSAYSLGLQYSCRVCAFLFTVIQSLVNYPTKQNDFLILIIKENEKQGSVSTWVIHWIIALENPICYSET